jgi:hypothetical protein
MVLAAVTVKSTVSWDVTPWSLERGTCKLAAAAAFLPGLLIEPEDGSDIIPQKSDLPYHTTFQPRRLYYNRLELLCMFA